MDQWAKWIAIAGLTAQLGELTYLHRVRELHHGYYGAAMSVFGAHIAPKHEMLGHSLEISGGYLLSDDLYQHGVQSWEKAHGEPIRPDFTPVHRLGAQVYGVILRWGF